MRLKLNGWQRIGIVVSVIWFVGLWLSSLHQQAQAKAKYVECLHIAEETMERCLAEWQRLDNSILANLGAVGRMDLRVLLAIDFGTIVFGWLLAWLAIVVARWIRRGFA
jgi:hypothetical protein